MDISINDSIVHSPPRTRRRLFVHSPPCTRRRIDPLQDSTDSNEHEDDEESYTEAEFYGLDVLDHPPDQADDEINYLPVSDRHEISSQRLVDNWTDVMISDHNETVTFVLDLSRKEAWSGLIDEVAYIRGILPSLLDSSVGDNTQDTTPRISYAKVLNLVFGKKSDFTTTFCNELDLSRLDFVNFMANLCLQMSYKESPSSLYDEYSLLKDDTVMSEDEYIGIWKKIATMKKVNSNEYIGSSRRPMCLWELCERAGNKILRSISIAGRTDDISIALDDDKVWVESSGKNQEDDFMLRKVTHVKDNRKGIVAHTAVSSTTNLPLSFMFERRKDKAVECFKRIFTNLFPSATGGAANDTNDLPDLFGVTNQSDRGYTLESTIFDFMLPSGADFNHTSKRIMPFPFVWGSARTTADDPRTVLEEKGAPTLYIKEIMKHNRLLTCAAFRTGTNNVSTVITTKIHGHQWEGISLQPKHRIKYENDPEHGLDEFLFKILYKEPSLIESHKVEMDMMLVILRSENIDVLTLEQGTADWHKGRQFSLTSSQANGSFDKAFINFQNDDDWCKVAEYLYGQNYHESK